MTSQQHASVSQRWFSCQLSWRHAAVVMSCSFSFFVLFFFVCFVFCWLVLLLVVVVVVVVIGWLVGWIVVCLFVCLFVPFFFSDELSQCIFISFPSTPTPLPSLSSLPSPQTPPPTPPHPPPLPLPTPPIPHVACQPSERRGSRSSARCSIGQGVWPGQGCSDEWWKVRPSSQPA